MRTERERQLGFFPRAELCSQRSLASKMGEEGESGPCPWGPGLVMQHPHPLGEGGSALALRVSQKDGGTWKSLPRRPQFLVFVCPGNAVLSACEWLLEVLPNPVNWGSGAQLHPGLCLQPSVRSLESSCVAPRDTCLTRCARSIGIILVRVGPVV